MEYKIKLKKEGRGIALGNLLKNFAGLKLSGSIVGIRDVEQDEDSATGIVAFHIDNLISYAVKAGFKALAFDIHEFAQVSIEAVKTQKPEPKKVKTSFTEEKSRKKSGVTRRLSSAKNLKKKSTAKAKKI